MRRYFVYSTLSTGVSYTDWHDHPDIDRNLARARHVVSIKGGAHVASHKGHLYTPKGVMTEISEEDYTVLQRNSLFQLHLKNGFIAIETDKIDADLVAKDMNPNDESRPVTPDDFVETKEGTKKLKKNRIKGQQDIMNGGSV